MRNIAPAVVVVLASTLAVPASGHQASTETIPGSVAAPTPAAATPTCGGAQPGSSGPASNSLPAQPLTTFASPAGGVKDFASGDGYVDTINSEAIDVYNTSGTELHSFPPPSNIVGAQDPSGTVGLHGLLQMVVGPDGTIYLGSHYAQVIDAISPTGTLLWSIDNSEAPNGMFPLTFDGSFALGVTYALSHASSVVYSSSGKPVGSAALVDNGVGGGYVTQAPAGSLLYGSNGYVQTWSADGQTLERSFGSSHVEGQGQHKGGPFQFFYQGQAVLGPDGNIYASDPLSTLTVTSPAGILLGATTLGGHLDLEGATMDLVGSDLLVSLGPAFNDTNATLAEIPLSTVQDYLAAPHPPTGALGWGAGLSTPVTANYFPPGSTPQVTANFDGWWTADAPQTSLAYQVWSYAELRAGSAPTSTLALPTSASALASIPLDIPAVDSQPGPYLVRAWLYDTAVSPPSLVGETCLPFTVGAAGDKLDFSTLPQGIGGGGPTDPRGVALNAQLGLDGYRGSSISWSTFLPNCSASSPTAATCGPSAMTFSSAPQSYFQAAGLASRDGVHYWVQVTGGGQVPSALVAGGWWGQDVQRLVSYYSVVPSGCSGCAAVSSWEPWNEPNNTGWADPSQYVSQVLKPFYQAVKSADPSATVIGGSSLGIPIGWWQGLVAAGGLSYMDVAGVHPYPGNNDSWEEDGIPAQLRALEATVAPKPVWITEVGWWGNGPFNYLHQADAVARAMIWQKALGIPVWNYFYDEGSWGNDGVSFSLVQTGSAGDDYVKPAALATMTEAAQTAGRPFVSMPSTGTPSVYQAEFGARSGGSTDLAAVWSDGLSTTVSVTMTSSGGGAIPTTVTDQYGSAQSATLTSGTSYSLAVSGQVTYLAYPAGDHLTVGPTVPFGTDLALASSGATASATSGNASAALVDPEKATGYGQGWSSSPGDTQPSLTVHLASPATVDRVIVDTQSLGSTAGGLRDYAVEAQTPSGSWSTLGTVSREFYDHQELVSFPPVTTQAVRVSVTEVNFGGYNGGAIPTFWSATTAQGAFVHAVEVYAGSAGPSMVDGTGLTPLPGTSVLATAPSSGSPTTTTVPASSSTTTTTPSGGGGGGGGGGGATGPTTTTTSSTTTTVAPSGGGTVSGGGSTTTTTTTTTTEPSTGGNSGVTGGTRGRHTLTASRALHLTGSSTAGGDTWFTDRSGQVFTLGGADFEGELRPPGAPAQPMVGIAATPDGRGYWLVGANGGVHPFGDARFYGSTARVHLPKPIVAIAATPDGRGYSLVGAGGLVYHFGR